MLHKVDAYRKSVVHFTSYVSKKCEGESNRVLERSVQKINGCATMLRLTNIRFRVADISLLPMRRWPWSVTTRKI